MKKMLVICPRLFSSIQIIPLFQVLGIMGALDPHVHKRNQQKSPGSHGEVNHAASDSGQHMQSMEELPADLWPSFATSVDYYSTIILLSYGEFH